MDKVYQKYKRLGQVTLMPLVLILAYILYFFSFFYEDFLRRLFSESFSLENNRSIEMLIIFAIFLVVFSGVFSGIISSIIYWANGYKQNEKWLRRAQNLRIYCWILLAIFGIGMVGIFFSLILQRI